MTRSTISSSIGSIVQSVTGGQEVGPGGTPIPLPWTPADVASKQWFDQARYSGIVGPDGQRYLVNDSTDPTAGDSPVTVQDPVMTGDGLDGGDTRPHITVGGFEPWQLCSVRNDFSVIFMFKFDTFPVAIVSAWASSGLDRATDKATMTFQLPNDRFGFEVSNGTNARSTFDNAQAFLGTDWHVGVATYDSATNTPLLRVDDIPADSTAYPNSGSYTDQEFRIGASTNGSQGFTGKWSRFAVYNRVLTPAEVTTASVDLEYPIDPVFAMPNCEGAGLTSYDMLGLHHGVISTPGGAFSPWGNFSNFDKDSCVLYGGRWDGTAFIPSLLDGSGAADGNPNNIAAGNVSPAALLDCDPLGTLASVAVNNPYAVDDVIEAEAVASTKFWRKGTSEGRDRWALTAQALADTDLTNMQDWIS